MRPRSGQRSQVLTQTPTHSNNLKHKLKHKLHSPPSHVPFTDSALIKKRTKPLTKSYDCLSMGIGAVAWLVCAWFGLNWCVILWIAPVVFPTKGRESHVQLCPSPCSSTHRWARITKNFKKKKKTVPVRDGRTLLSV